ncbi:Uu.00g027350.m01.CDS01 [Anthostomella pinea]|uniref:Uu.00g027350.m01.CDS01 n=1 Tax=Anthostomella pinea TaxID=933095 RepID=A0AAI8V877_9PEZI|nr:Uu.00g027350.m01.CDS01 [Anthostomella pinea]
MAPIRRYLRITKYSVLECRIYLDNPALAQTWLLNPRKPVLQRVIDSVRPYVLPKLREERERSRKKSTKKKGIKDVVVEDDFEVSIFLTDTSTRHSLLTKHKHFHDTTQTKLTSNSGRLMGATNEAPIDVDTVVDTAPAAIRREESDDEDVAAALAAIPAVDETVANRSRRPKRARRNTETDADHAAGDPNSALEVISDDDDQAGAGGEDDEDDGLFVHSPEDGSMRPPPAKRRREGAAGAGEDDDKKKLAMDISYEGFSIYGRVLCLVVKRHDVGPFLAGRSGMASAGAGGSGSGAAKAGGGQAMMENFIISTQVPAGADAP